MSRAFETTAREASRAIRDPLERESSRVEVLGHLEDAAEAHARAGLRREEAEERAIRDFGDLWKVRIDLARVHRGRRAVVFPRTTGERLLAVAIYDLGPLLVALAVVLLLRWQVVQAYSIPTKSMEPTLRGDALDPDYILVNKTAFLWREPRRFEVVVFYPPETAHQEERTAFVKRCTGLPGETLDIRGGDLYADGVLARRPPEVEDAMLVPAYDLGEDLGSRVEEGDSREDLVRRFFERTWEEVAGGWRLEGSALAATAGPEGQARLRYRPEITNSYFDATETRARFKVHEFFDAVGDLEVRFVVVPGAGTTAVGADLVEGSDRHALRIRPGGLVLTSGGRSWPRPGVRALPGHPLEVRFRNVDARLTVFVDGERVLSEALDAGPVVPSGGERGGVELVVEGGPARFEGVRIRRDILYLRESRNDARPWPRKVPEDCYFMMGDNTGSSNDSRMWGPVRREDLIGSPFVVMYPPSRMKVVR